MRHLTYNISDKDRELLYALDAVTSTYGYTLSLRSTTTDDLTVVATAWEEDAVGALELCRLIAACTSWSYFEAAKVAALGRIDIVFVVRAANKRMIRIGITPGRKDRVPKSPVSSVRAKDYGLSLWY